MKILIDARMYGLENAGIGRYVMNLVENLKSVDKKNQYILFLNKKYYDLLKIPNRWKKVLVDIPHYSLAEQIKLPGIINKEKPDLVHFPHFNRPYFYKGKYVMTIHDLIKHFSRGVQTTTRHPWFYWLKYLGYKEIFERSVKGAKKILVPSWAVKEELLKVYPLSQDKIIVTYEGVDEKYQDPIGKMEGEKVLKKYQIKRPFVIYTGSVYPHKNVERLVVAIKLIEQQTQLVIVCARSVFWERLRKEIQNQKAEAKVVLVGFIPDEELKVLYHQAESFVFPTLVEGFGLPGLEAMAAGLPVVCSNIPVLKEIYQEAALYFDPLDPQDMAEKIKIISKNVILRTRLINKGFVQIKKYSWQKMARETMAVYEKTDLRRYDDF